VAEGGFKGLAIHARRGNKTEYMSRRWFDLCRHVCEEALRLGLDIWLYDEEGFPSGSVGTRLPKDHPRYQHKSLRYGYVRASQLGQIENLVAAYDAVTFERLFPCSRVRQAENAPPPPRTSLQPPPTGDHAGTDPDIAGTDPDGAGTDPDTRSFEHPATCGMSVSVSSAVAGHRRSSTETGDVLAFWLVYCRDLRLVDTLKSETAERFMDLTHRKYYEFLKDYFGKPITHVYTDDLYIYHHCAGEGLSYTENLPAVFAEHLGYDFFDVLPKLVENLPGSAKARLDWRGFTLDLFLNRYVEPVYRWCRGHGVRFTGHLCGDEGPISKAMIRLGSPMAFYEFEDIPGVD